MNNEDPIRRKTFLMGLIVIQSTRDIKNFNFLRSEVEKDGQNLFNFFSLYTTQIIVLKILLLFHLPILN